MLKIRLQRVGRKHEPVFRLVLTDSKNSTKSGKFIENLGNYDSRRGEGSTFNADKIKSWMAKGAQVSTTVHNLLVNKKIVEGKKLNALPLKKAIVKEVENKNIETPIETPEVKKPEVTEEVEAVEDPIKDVLEEKSSSTTE